MNTLHKSVITSLILGLLMCCSAVLSNVMRNAMQADKHHEPPNLESIIPKEFGVWRLDSAATALVVNPDDNALLNKLYSQTLSRTYINNKAERVMLSIAYGGDQRSDLHVHRPEICYATSGFDISNVSKRVIETTIGTIPVMNLVATQRNRNEPITYWIRIGDSLTRGWIEQKLIALAHGLAGKVPDGLLFRISSISNNEEESYLIQKQFLTDITLAIKREDLPLLIGNIKP